MGLHATVGRLTAVGHLTAVGRLMTVGHLMAVGRLTAGGHLMAVGVILLVAVFSREGEPIRARKSCSRVARPGKVSFEER